MFKELEDAELGLIADRMESVNLAAKAELLVQNKDAEAVYFLVKGAVKILVNGEMVAQVDTVQCFGEMSCLIPQTPASATVVTAVDSEAFKIPKAAFLEVVDRIPRLWKTLFLQMNGRFKAVTMRLAEVLEHTPQGLVKVDKKGKITNEYSHQCTAYFEKDNLAGLEFAKLVHPGDSDAQGLWEQTYPMLFDEGGMLAFSDVAGLLDQELEFVAESGARKQFVFSYYPCRNIAGAIEAIDIGIEDVTEARELERKNNEMLAEQATMGKIYENPESFLSFKAFFVQTLSDSVSYIQKLRAKQSAPNDDQTKDFMRRLHSLKGYSGVFALSPVQKTMHHMEDAVKGNLESAPAEIQTLIEGLVDLKGAYLYTEGMFNRIGESLRKRLIGVPLSPDEFRRLKAAALGGDLASIVKLTEAVERVDCAKLVAAWPDEAAKIAGDLGKEVLVTLDGEGGPVPKRVFEDLDRCLIHLLRNAVDHGIESAEERTAAGKPTCGNMRVAVAATEDRLTLEVSDDGHGIDFSKLGERAADNERLDQEAVAKCIEAGEPWKILFMSGFSTKDEITELSGRGVGLAAIKSVVDSYEGSIKLETQPGAGTTFKLEFKIPQEAPEAPIDKEAAA